MLEEEYDYYFKILVIDWDHNIMNAPWSDRPETGTWTYVHHLKNGAIVKCDMWNFNYHNEHWEVNDLYNASGALIIYNIYDQNSLSKVSLLLNDLKEFTRPGLIISFVGNKSDYNEIWQRYISKKEGARFVKRNELRYENINWSKNNQIEKVFSKLIKTICDQTIDRWNRLLKGSHKTKSSCC